MSIKAQDWLSIESPYVWVTQDGHRNIWRMEPRQFDKPRYRGRDDAQDNHEHGYWGILPVTRYRLVLPHGAEYRGERLQRAGQASPGFADWTDAQLFVRGWGLPFPPHMRVGC